MTTPAVVDLNSSVFADQVWVQSDRENYELVNGNPVAIGDLPESTSAQRPTAEWANAVNAVLRQVSAVFRGTSMPTALQIATYFRLPRYTTAELTDPLAVEQGAGATAYDTDLEVIVTSNGTTWSAAGGIASLGDGTARSVFGRASNTAGVHADIVGAGTAAAPAILSDNGTTVAFRTLALLSDTVLYDVDYGSVTPVTLADGSRVIGAHTWTIANAAAATTFEVGATGIVFDANTTNTVYTTTRSASYLRIVLGTLIPSWDPLRTYVIDAYFTTLTIASATNRVFIGIDADGAGTDRHAGGGPRGGGSPTTHVQNDSNILAGLANGGHDQFSIRISPESVLSSSGTMGADFRVPELVGSYYAHTSPNGGHQIMDPASFLSIAFVTGEVGGAMAVTLRRLRVRRI